MSDDRQKHCSEEKKMSSLVRSFRFNRVLQPLGGFRNFTMCSTHDPFTGELIFSEPYLTEDEANIAIRRLEEAQKQWSLKTLEERQAAVAKGIR